MEDDSVHVRYLKLYEEIRRKKSELDEDKSRLDSIIEETDGLFEMVKTSDSLKLDAKVSALYSDIYLKILSRYASLNKMSSKDFISIIDEHGSKFFQTALKRYRGLNFVDFIDFDLTITRQQRSHERLRKDEAAAEEPKNKHIEEDFTAEKLFEDSVQKILEKSSSINLFNLVINPDSYSKTIENIFYLSLMNRNKTISFYTVDNEVQVTKYHKNKDEIYDEHFIFTITYEEYIEYIERYKITEPLL